MIIFLGQLLRRFLKSTLDQIEFVRAYPNQVSHEALVHTAGAKQIEIRLTDERNRLVYKDNTYIY